MTREPVTWVKMEEFMAILQPLTHEQAGALGTLMAHYEADGYLPGSVASLRRLTRCRSVRQWSRIWPAIREHFERNGRLFRIPMMDRWLQEFTAEEPDKAREGRDYQ
jgi:uncharacterized protein YdaU (DUF1376 family)